jgi:hypothetical protein
MVLFMFCIILTVTEWLGEVISMLNEDKEREIDSLTLEIMEATQVVRQTMEVFAAQAWSLPTEQILLLWALLRACAVNYLNVF